MLRSFFAALMFLALDVGSPCFAQRFEFQANPGEDWASLTQSLASLSRNVLAAYHDPDRLTYLDNLFRLQQVAKQYSAAIQTLAALEAQPGSTAHTRATSALYTAWTRAKLADSGDRSRFEDSFKEAFQATVGRLDDKSAALVAAALTLVDSSEVDQVLRQTLQAHVRDHSLSLSDALALIRAYQIAQAYRDFSGVAATLVAEDDARRFQIDKDIQVSTPDGAIVCALVMRPRRATGPLPTLLEFTIYADPARAFREARRSAAHGYLGVEGFTRGKACSPGPAIPIEHDGADAAALIDWISKQPWSDGRVGMFGGSYNGFTQWATAKFMPKALKGMMPSVTFAPGIDFPMPGGIYQNYGYPWPFFTTNLRTLDNATYGDAKRWNNLNRAWYVSGRPYRDLEKIDGTPNPTWDRWLSHPTYDDYWQSLIPSAAGFARIDIPVLTTTGYFDDGQIGALYYFQQHSRFRSGAEHYLVVGPYDHITGQRGTIDLKGDTLQELLGYKLDQVAQLDIGELRYQWFDYVFKKGPRPPLLEDKVNYEVMGANTWRHVPSLSAMADNTLRYYLATAVGSRSRRLSLSPAQNSSVAQSVDLKDRSDVDQFTVADAPGSFDTWDSSGYLIGTPDLTNGMLFVGDPLPQALEFDGLFGGKLDFVTNKKDFDFELTVYRVTPDGQYLHLAYYMTRASLAEDRTHRRLLMPGHRTRMSFRTAVLMGCRFERGSRVALVLRLLKRPDMEINYGTGSVVSDESIRDAAVPLEVKWFGDSHIDFPTRH